MLSGSPWESIKNPQNCEAYVEQRPRAAFAFSPFIPCTWQDNTSANHPRKLQQQQHAPTQAVYSMFIRFIDLGYLGFFLILVRFVSARRQAPALEVDLCRWEDFNFSKAFHSRFNLATLAIPWPFLSHSRSDLRHSRSDLEPLVWGGFSYRHASLFFAPNIKES